MHIHPADVIEARALAEIVLIETKLDGDEQPDPVLVAEALKVSVFRVPIERLTHGSWGVSNWVDGGYVIEVLESLPVSQRQAIVAHELGHICSRLWGVVPFEWERFAWIFAGALLVRDEPLRAAWKRHGELDPILRDWDHVPPTATALALGEAGIAPLYVVQDAAERYRRAPGPASVKAIAAASSAASRGHVKRPGIKAYRLVDAPRRAAVLLQAG